MIRTVFTGTQATREIFDGMECDHKIRSRRILGRLNVREWRCVKCEMRFAYLTAYKDTGWRLSQNQPYDVLLAR